METKDITALSRIRECGVELEKDKSYTVPADFADHLIKMGWAIPKGGDVPERPTIVREHILEIHDITHEHDASEA